MNPYYQDDSVTIYHGEAEELIPVVGSFDLVLTDPPYSSPTTGIIGRNAVRRLSDLSIQAFFMREIAKLWKKHGSEKLRLFVFCDDQYYPVLSTAFYEWETRQMVVWDKGRIGMGRGFRRSHELIIHASVDGFDMNVWPEQTSHASVLRFKPVAVGDRLHGSEKPADLLSYLIRAGSKEGDTVLDCFGGSGSVAPVAKALGRKTILIEAEEANCEVATKRLCQGVLL